MMRLPLLFGCVLVWLTGCGALQATPPAFAAGELQRWHAVKAQLGPVFAGSPAWHAHMQFVERQLAEAGVVEVQKYPAPYRRWWAPDDPAPAERALVVDGRAVSVASYWAYSGATPPDGVTAPLLRYAKGMTAAELAGHIVVFEVRPAPAAMAEVFAVGHEYATADFAAASAGITDEQWYQGNYVTRFGRFDEALRDSGAAGAVVIFDLPFERVAGLYTFPLLNTGVIGVPGVYVDATAGAAVRAAAERGAVASLTLRAQEGEVTPYFYTAVLPGRDHGTAQEREVLLVTHSDGPNLTQENGTLGIAALVQYFARRPQAERTFSLRVLFDPQHYSPGRHTIDWYALHPEVMRRIVGIVGVEQLGQLEYGVAEDGAYGLTGRPEPWQIFVRDDSLLITAAIAAIDASGVPRTELRVPERKGQGRWTGLAEVAIQRDIPGYGTLSGMSGYWGTTAGIESFDVTVAVQQLELLAQLISVLGAPL